mgnify:CR=1 FL=1
MAPYETKVLVFHSSMFPIEQGEDAETNPGVFGRSLAVWLGQELVPEFTSDQVLAEDFGWLVPVSHPKCSLYIACQMSDASPRECMVQIIAEGGWKERLRLRDPRAQARRELLDRVKARLEREPEIRDLHAE